MTDWAGGLDDKCLENVEELRILWKDIGFRRTGRLEDLEGKEIVEKWEIYFFKSGADRERGKVEKTAPRMQAKNSLDWKLSAFQS